MLHLREQRRQRATVCNELCSAPSPFIPTHLTMISQSAHQLFPTTDAKRDSRLCKSIALQKQFSLYICGVRLENVPRRSAKDRNIFLSVF